MTSRRLIGVAVTAACAMLSVNASAQTVRSAESDSYSHPIMVQEVNTPFSPNESGPSWPMRDTRARHTPAESTAYVSLPNPQTPFSPNESGPVNYAQEMRERAQHVANVTRARVNVARIESERLAAIERERVEAAERERLAALERERLERERLAGTQTSTAGEAGMSAAPVGGTSSAAGGSSATITAPAESNAMSTVPAPVPAPQREAQADPDAALVDTRSTLGTGTGLQESNVMGSAPAEGNASANVSTEARRPDQSAASASMGGNSTSIGASGTVAGGGIDDGNTPRDNNRLMLQGGNADSAPR
ncbi:MAG TPA: hypothetical protein VFI62_16820 [Burkholderiales bacterium]|nr:hypothetical protein [Burkholderiales bacterium]